LAELNEQLIPRGLPGKLPALVLEAPPPETPGSVAWVAEAVFGGQRQFEDMLTSIVVGQGAKGDPKWRHLVSVILKLREVGEIYNLNQLCMTLNITSQSLLEFIGTGVRTIQSHIATMKASLAAPDVINSALMASQDWEKGGKDREMLLKIAGVIEPSGSGVSVNVNQQVSMKVGKEELLAPLRQFQGVAEAIDNSVRGEAIDGEIVD
jgi:hypothetical protein